MGNYQTARDGRRNDRVKRREFITLLGGVASWPIATRAQQPERMRRIGVLEPIAVDDPEALASHGLRAGAAAVGLDRQPQCADRLSLGAGGADRIRQQAVELAALAPDAILTVATATAAPVLRATRTVPIVFVAVVDPVGAGYVDSLARPGGNATGFTNYEFSMGASSIVLLSARDRALEALDECPLRAALRAASRLRFRRPPPLAHLCCRRTSTCDPGHPARSAPIARLLPLP